MSYTSIQHQRTREGEKQIQGLPVVLLGQLGPEDKVAVAAVAIS